MARTKQTARVIGGPHVSQTATKPSSAPVPKPKAAPKPKSLEKSAKKPKCEKVQWDAFIYKVLKQVHPDAGSTDNAKKQMNSFTNAIALKLAQQAKTLTLGGKKKTIDARSIQIAVRILIPGELAKHSVSEGTKAITKLEASKEVQAASTSKNTQHTSLAARSGLVFPPARAAKYLEEFGTSKLHVSKSAKVYLAAVLEYLSAEVLELSGNAARDAKKIRINARHIFLAIYNDEELTALVKRFGIVIINGGVLPNIHSQFLKSKDKKAGLAKQRRKKKKGESGEDTGVKKPKKYLPGTTAVREIKSLQKDASPLIFGFLPFKREIKNVISNFIDDGIRLAENMVITFQYYIQYRIIDILQSALLITTAANVQTLKANHINTCLKIKNYTFLYDLYLHTPKPENITREAIKKLCKMAGAVRVGSDAIPLVRQIIGALMTHTLRIIMNINEYDRTKTLSVEMIKQAIQSDGYTVSCIEKKSQK